MTATSPELFVELIEEVLKEKEAALAKEQALLEDLKRVLSRMGYELIPFAHGKMRRTSSSATAPNGRGRGRPRKNAIISSPSAQNAAGE